MSATEVQTKKNRDMRRSMASAMKSLMGPGFVDDYYWGLASDFIIVAECYADDVATPQFVPWRARLTWHPYTEVSVIAEHAEFVWAVDDDGEPYTLRADCIERVTS